MTGSEAVTHSFCSLQTTFRVCSRKISHLSITEIGVCAASNTVSRLRHPMRSLCVCQSPCQDRESVFLKRSGVALPEISHAAAWVSRVTHTVAGSRCGRTSPSRLQQLCDILTCIFRTEYVGFGSGTMKVGSQIL